MINLETLILIWQVSVSDTLWIFASKEFGIFHICFSHSTNNYGILCIWYYFYRMIWTSDLSCNMVILLIRPDLYLFIGRDIFYITWICHLIYFNFFISLFALTNIWWQKKPYSRGCNISLWILSMYGFFVCHQTFVEGHKQIMNLCCIEYITWNKNYRPDVSYYVLFCDCNNICCKRWNIIA